MTKDVPMRGAHHQNPALIAVVVVGGMIGTGARYAVTRSVPSPGGWPLATFAENIVGAFLLGALLEALLRHGPETSRGRVVRLGLGTGVLGGFTTFSSLALDTERLLADGAVGSAVSYAAASLVGGFLVCLLGVAVAARHHEWRHGRLPRDPDALVPDPSGAPAAPSTGEGERR